MNIKMSIQDISKYFVLRLIKLLNHSVLLLQPKSNPYKIFNFALVEYFVLIIENVYSALGSGWLSG